MKTSEKALLPPVDIRQPSGVEALELDSATPTMREDLMTLTKARLSALVLVTTLVGFLLASHGATLDWQLLFHVIFGTGCVAAASSVFNQMMERDTDRRMNRTRDRPLPSGRMGMAGAAAIGSTLCLVGFADLLVFANETALMLAVVTFVVYLAVYTPMKRFSTWCTLVGAVAGAVPPMIGWAGVTNSVTEPAWVLFGILFFWQLPHFLAINWMYRDEYKRAGFVMWSNNDESGRSTAQKAVGFSFGMLAVSLWPWFADMVSVWYLPGAVLLSGGMIWLSLRFLRLRTVPAARALFFYTLAFLPALLGLMLILSTRAPSLLVH